MYLPLLPLLPPPLWPSQSVWAAEMAIYMQSSHKAKVKGKMGKAKSEKPKENVPEKIKLAKCEKWKYLHICNGRTNVTSFPLSPSLSVSLLLLLFVFLCCCCAFRALNANSGRSQSFLYPCHCLLLPAFLQLPLPSAFLSLASFLVSHKWFNTWQLAALAPLLFALLFM